MDYSYTIERLSTKQRFLRVRFESEGSPDVRRNLRTDDFSPEALRVLIERVAPGVIAEWEAMALQPDETEDTLGIDLTGTASYTPPEPPAVDPVSQAIQRVAEDRWVKESVGIVWTEPGTEKTFFLDTSSDSQSRFAAARLAAQVGNREDGAVWKLAEVTADGPVLTFRPTTNAELSEWAGLVHAHVQKCFQAEANTVAKIFSGDLTADFETEFMSL